MDMLVIGSAALDTIETPFGRRDEIIGGSATYASAAASYFTRAHIMACVGDDFPEHGLEFYRNLNVDTSGLERVAGRTFRWSGRYDKELANRTTLLTELGVFASFAPKLTQAHREIPFLFLGNIDPDLQIQVLDQLTSPKFVALDTMNYWIERKLEALRHVLGRVHAVLLNESEARQISCEGKIVRAARAIRKLGPKVVVIKCGEFGAALFSEDSLFHVPAYPTADVMDTTGAGDTFAGAFVGYLAQMGEVTDAYLRQAAVMGSVLASFCVERFGPEGIASRSRTELRARAGDFRRLLHFDDIAALSSLR